MDIISNQDEDESKSMTLYSKLSAPEPFNLTDTIKTALTVDNDDKF